MFRRYPLWVFLLIFTLAGPAVSGQLALAQSPENVQINVTADRNELLVGDPVMLLVEVIHHPDYQVVFPSLSPQWGDFEVRSQSHLETVDAADGMQKSFQTIEVTLFAPGTYETPELFLTIGDPDGHITQEQAPSISLTVNSVLDGEDVDLRDIKPQADLPVAPLWPWITAALLLGVGLAWAGWRFTRRFRRGGVSDVPEIVDLRPAYQVALDELDRIESLDLIQQGLLKQHYSLASECLRSCLEQQLNVRALDRTTSEIKSNLQAAAIQAPLTRQLVEVFQESDLVKFAKLRPAVEQARQLIPRARTLVNALRPVSEDETDTGDNGPASGTSANISPPQQHLPRSLSLLHSHHGQTARGRKA